MTDFMDKICTKFDFGWGSAPDHGELTAPQDPSCIWGLLLREGEGRGEEGRGGDRKGGERREESVPIVPVLRNDH